MPSIFKRNHFVVGKNFLFIKLRDMYALVYNKWVSITQIGLSWYIASTLQVDCLKSLGYTTV